MSDLISREAVIKVLDELEELEGNENNIKAEMARLEVSLLPAVEPQECGKKILDISDGIVKIFEPQDKVGKWIELPKALNPNENPCKCSNCGHILSFMNYYPKSNYCPNCGAKMEV